MMHVFGNFVVILVRVYKMVCVDTKRPVKFTGDDSIYSIETLFRCKPKFFLAVNSHECHS